MTMTHSNIALLEKINQLINNDLGNFRFSELFTLKKTSQIRLIILSCFSQYTHCQSPQLSPQQTRTQRVAYSAMLASQNRVHSMDIIHQKLYQGGHLAAIEMRDYFINLGENIVSSFNAEERVKVECDMPQLLLDGDTAISIGLIPNELLTNSLKYAFAEKENGNINITLNVENIEDGLLLKVSDDGIGKILVEKAKGTGFVRNLFHCSQGNWTVD